MARREKTEITIETESVLVVRHRHAARRWCGACGHETDFVPFECELNLPQGLAGGGQAKLHLGDGEDGKRLVCMESFLKAVQHSLENQQSVSGWGSKPQGIR